MNTRTRAATRRASRQVTLAVRADDNHEFIATRRPSSVQAARGATTDLRASCAHAPNHRRSRRPSTPSPTARGDPPPLPPQQARPHTLLSVACRISRTVAQGSTHTIGAAPLTCVMAQACRVRRHDGGAQAYPGCCLACSARQATRAVLQQPARSSVDQCTRPPNLARSRGRCRPAHSATRCPAHA